MHLSLEQNWKDISSSNTPWFSTTSQTLFSLFFFPLPFSPTWLEYISGLAKNMSKNYLKHWTWHLFWPNHCDESGSPIVDHNNDKKPNVLGEANFLYFHLFSGFYVLLTLWESNNNFLDGLNIANKILDACDCSRNSCDWTPLLHFKQSDLKFPR